MGFETEREREALASAWGDFLVSGANRIPGQYDEPRAEAALIEGASPTFRAYRVHLDAAGVSVGTTGLSVETHDGRAISPFRVKNIPDAEIDGAFWVLGLEKQ